MNKAQADEWVQTLRGIVPSNWTVEARNTEIRPGQPERYKVVAFDAGLALVVHPDTQKVYVTIDSGPGPVENVSARSIGDMGFDDASVAFENLKARIVDRHKRVSNQFASITGRGAAP